MGITNEDLKNLKGNRIVLEKHKDIYIEQNSDSFIKRKHTIVREKFPVFVPSVKKFQNIKSGRQRAWKGSIKRNLLDSLICDTEEHKKFEQQLNNTTQHLNHLEAKIQHEINNIKLERSFLKINVNLTQDKKKKTAKYVTEQQHDKTWAENLAANNEVTKEKFPQQHQCKCTSPRFDSDIDIAIRPKMRTVGLQMDSPKVFADRGAVGDHNSLSKLSLKAGQSEEKLATNIKELLLNPVESCACIKHSNDCLINCCYGLQCVKPNKYAVCKLSNMVKTCCGGVLCNQRTYQESGVTPHCNYNYCQHEFYYDYPNNQQRNSLINPCQCACDYNNSRTTQTNFKRHGTDLNTQEFCSQKFDRSSPTKPHLPAPFKKDYKLKEKYETMLKTYKKPRGLEQKNDKERKAQEISEDQVLRRNRESEEKQVQEELAKSKERSKSKEKRGKNNKNTTGEELLRKYTKKIQKDFYVNKNIDTLFGKQKYTENLFTDESSSTPTTLKVRNEEKIMSFKSPKSTELYDDSRAKENEYSLETLKMLKKMTIREYKPIKSNGKEVEKSKRTKQKINEEKEEKAKKYKEYVNNYNKKDGKDIEEQPHVSKEQAKTPNEQQPILEDNLRNSEYQQHKLKEQQQIIENEIQILIDQPQFLTEELQLFEVQPQFLREQTQVSGYQQKNPQQTSKEDHQSTRIQPELPNLEYQLPTTKQRTTREQLQNAIGQQQFPRSNPKLLIEPSQTLGEQPTISKDNLQISSGEPQSNIYYSNSNIRLQRSQFSKELPQTSKIQPQYFGSLGKSSREPTQTSSNQTQTLRETRQSSRHQTQTSKEQPQTFREQLQSSNNQQNSFNDQYYSNEEERYEYGAVGGGGWDDYVRQNDDMQRSSDQQTLESYKKLQTSKIQPQHFGSLCKSSREPTRTSSNQTQTLRKKPQSSRYRTQTSEEHPQTLRKQLQSSKNKQKSSNDHYYNNDEERYEYGAFGGGGWDDYVRQNDDQQTLESYKSKPIRDAIEKSNFYSIRNRGSREDFDQHESIKLEGYKTGNKRDYKKLNLGFWRTRDKEDLTIDSRRQKEFESVDKPSYGRTTYDLAETKGYTNKENRDFDEGKPRGYQTDNKQDFYGTKHQSEKFIISTDEEGLHFQSNDRNEFQTEGNKDYNRELESTAFIECDARSLRQINYDRLGDDSRYVRARDNSENINAYDYQKPYQLEDDDYDICKFDSTRRESKKADIHFETTKQRENRADNDKTYYERQEYIESVREPRYDKLKTLRVVKYRTDNNGSDQQNGDIHFKTKIRREIRANDGSKHYQRQKYSESVKEPRYDKQKSKRYLNYQRVNNKSDQRERESRYDDQQTPRNGEYRRATDNCNIKYRSHDKDRLKSQRNQKDEKSYIENIQNYFDRYQELYPSSKSLTDIKTEEVIYQDEDCKLANRLAKYKDELKRRSPKSFLAKQDSNELEQEERVPRTRKQAMDYYLKLQSDGFKLTEQNLKTQVTDSSSGKTFNKTEDSPKKQHGEEPVRELITKDPSSDLFSQVSKFSQELECPKVTHIKEEISPDETFDPSQNPINSKDALKHLTNFLTSYQQHGFEKECLNNISTVANDLLMKLSSCKAQNSNSIPSFKEDTTKIMEKHRTSKDKLMESLEAKLSSETNYTNLQSTPNASPREMKQLPLKNPHTNPTKVVEVNLQTSKEIEHRTQSQEETATNTQSFSQPTNDIQNSQTNEAKSVKSHQSLKGNPTGMSEINLQTNGENSLKNQPSKILVDTEEKVSLFFDNRQHYETLPNQETSALPANNHDYKIEMDKINSQSNDNKSLENQQSKILPGNEESQALLSFEDPKSYKTSPNHTTLTLPANSHRYKTGTDEINSQTIKDTSLEHQQSRILPDNESEYMVKHSDPQDLNQAIYENEHYHLSETLNTKNNYHPSSYHPSLQDPSPNLTGMKEISLQTNKEKHLENQQSKNLHDSEEVQFHPNEDHKSLPNQETLTLHANDCYRFKTEQESYYSQNQLESQYRETKENYEKYAEYSDCHKNFASLHQPDHQQSEYIDPQDLNQSHNYENNQCLQLGYPTMTQATYKNEHYHLSETQHTQCINHPSHQQSKYMVQYPSSQDPSQNPTGIDNISMQTNEETFLENQQPKNLPDSKEVQFYPSFKDPKHHKMSNHETSTLSANEFYRCKTEQESFYYQKELDPQYWETEENYEKYAEYTEYQENLASLQPQQQLENMVKNSGSEGLNQSQTPGTNDSCHPLQQKSEYMVDHPTLQDQYQYQSESPRFENQYNCLPKTCVTKYSYLPLPSPSRVSQKSIGNTLQRNRISPQIVNESADVLPLKGILKPCGKNETNSAICDLETYRTTSVVSLNREERININKTSKFCDEDINTIITKDNLQQAMKKQSKLLRSELNQNNSLEKQTYRPIRSKSAQRYVESNIPPPPECACMFNKYFSMLEIYRKGNKKLNFNKNFWEQ